MSTENPLSPLIDSLTPEELVEHPYLASLYKAAGAIAVSSYNGHFNTDPVGPLTEQDAALVHRLLNRYRDDQDFIRFPLLHPTSKRIAEIVISGEATTSYRLVVRHDPTTKQEVTYFTSFPNLEQ